MIIIDIITKENNNKKKHNEKQPYIPDLAYRILITGGLDQGKQTHYLI